MIRKDKHPAAAAAAQDEEQGADVAGQDELGPDETKLGPSLTDYTPSDEITEAAEHHRQAAGTRRHQAAKDQAAAEEILAAARDEAARIMAKAEADAHPLATSASAAEQEAGMLAERAQRLDNAAFIAAKTEAGEARVQALEDERDALTEKQADLGRHLAEMAGQRRDLEPQLAAALDDADLELIASLRTKLDSIGALEEALRAQQAPVIARLDAIGDGEISPIWPQRELAEAKRVVYRGEVRRALNWAFPDRQEAAADREREHELALDQYRGDQYRAEKAESRPQIIRS